MSPALSEKDSLHNARKGGVRILVVTGISGGHIFPARGFLDTLKDKYKEIEALLVLPKSNLVNQIITDAYKTHYISISTVKLTLNFKNFIAILKFLKGTLESLNIILEFNPDMVVGFGSVSCIPIILLAWIFRIKTLIHEQNVIPGRANRFLAKFVDKIAISFEETREHFKGCQDKIVLTGNPLRKELNKLPKFKALDFFGFSYDKFTILIMGGSRGSRRINVGFLNAISKIYDRYKLQIIHLTGIRDYDLLNQGYQNLNLNFKLFKFFKPMQYAYSASDLLVSRAGATTISEAINFCLPAIIVPYPFAYNHQISNALVLKNQGCAIIIKDRELDSDVLRQTLEGLLDNPEKIKKMRSGYDFIAKLKGSDLLVDEVMSLVYKVT